MNQTSRAASTLPNGSDEVFPPTETYLLRSGCVAQTFKIQVMQPPRREGGTRCFPVVYATDGNVVFDMFKGICWLMQRGERVWPPFILVTIGYPGDALTTGSLLRCRDFTFPGYPNVVDGNARLQGFLAPEAGTRSFGGAEDFQAFFADELIPRMDAQYPTIPGHRTYFGHSMGGSFGLFTLLSQPALFKNYVISSPATSYHGDTPAGIRHDNDDFILERFRRFVADGKALEDARLHMSVGTDEEFDPLLIPWQISSSFLRLVAFLTERRIRGLDFTYQILPGRNHLTAWPIAFMDGIQAVFCAA